VLISVAPTRTPIERPTINLTSGMSQKGVTISIEIEELADTVGSPLDTAWIVIVFVCPMRASSGTLTRTVAFPVSPISSDILLGSTLISQPIKFSTSKPMVSGAVPKFFNSREKIASDPGEVCLSSGSVVMLKRYIAVAIAVPFTFLVKFWFPREAA